MYNNPNTIKSYKILQKLSPEHAAHGVAQSTYPIYRHRKTCLSKQAPWRAAGDPHLARSRSRVRAPGPAGALRVLFFSTLPSFLLREIVFSHLPYQPRKSVRVNKSCGSYLKNESVLERGELKTIKTLHSIRTCLYSIVIGSAVLRVHGSPKIHMKPFA